MIMTSLTRQFSYCSTHSVYLLIRASHKKEVLLIFVRVELNTIGKLLVREP